MCLPGIWHGDGTAQNGRLLITKTQESKTATDRLREYEYYAVLVRAPLPVL